MAPNSPNGKTALITGAAAGLGAQFAQYFAKAGFHIILVDRYGDRAAVVADSLTQNHGVRTHVIEQDLCDPTGAASIREACEAIRWQVDVLVNNAGYPLNRPMHLLPWPATRDNIQLLLRSTVEMCHRFLPAMIERGWGRIINVSSVSGFLPGSARLASYNASKAFLIPFSEGIGLDLAGTGVNVTVVCPGFMKTNIFKTSGLEDVQNAVPSFMWQDPAEVASEAVRAVFKGKPVHVSGLANRLIVTAAKFVPRALLRERARILHTAFHRSRAVVEDAPVSDRKKVAVVTGASSGIGAHLSEVLARHGYDVMIVARRGDVLEQRAKELSDRYRVRVHAVVQDLAETNAAECIDLECLRLGLSVDVLVNNAAYPVTQVFHKMKWPEVNAALNVLIGAPVELTHRFVTKMTERGSGRIINIASVAALQPGTAGSAIYTASKIFLLGFSESIAADVKDRGVSVTAICPGFTRTGWFGNTNLATASVPNFFWMDSEDVAAATFEAAQRGATVSIVGTVPLRAMYALFRMMPRRFVAAMLSQKRKRTEVARS